MYILFLFQEAYFYFLCLSPTKSRLMSGTVALVEFILL